MQAVHAFGEGESLVATIPAAPGVTSAGFVMCPLAWMGTGGINGGMSWAQEIYRLAYEQARAALRPSWYERALGTSPN